MRLEDKLKQALRSNNIDKVHEVYDEIYNEYHKLVYYIIINIMKDDNIACELTNDTFLKAYNNINSFVSDVSLKAWVSRIAHNTAINEFNRQKREETFGEVELIKDSNYDNNQRFFRIVEMFKDYISDEEIDIIVLHVYYQMRFVEISEMYNCSLTDVTNKYNKSLKVLRKYFKKGDF